jgi:peroxiredoxin family protein
VSGARVIVLARSGEPDRLRFLAEYVAAQLSLGREVDLFLSGGALSSFLHRDRRGGPAPGERREAGRDVDADDENPWDLVERARGVGLCRLLACSASAAREEVTRDELLSRLDDVVGLAALLARAGAGDVQVVF